MNRRDKRPQSRQRPLAGMPLEVLRGVVLPPVLRRWRGNEN